MTLIVANKREFAKIPRNQLPLRLASHSVLLLKGNSLWHPTPHRHSKDPVTSEAASLQPLVSSESVQQSLKSRMRQSTQRRERIFELIFVYILSSRCAQDVFSVSHVTPNWSNVGKGARREKRGAALFMRENTFLFVARLHVIILGSILRVLPQFRQIF